MLTLLLTSAAAKIPMLKAIKQAAVRLDDKAQVIAGDSDNEAISQYFADNFWCMPAVCAANIQLIVEGLKSRNITHVIPSRDAELQFWATNRELLKQHHIELVCASSAALDLCLDKLKFAQLNSPTIAASEAIDLLDTHQSSDTHQPLDTPRYVVKERFGAGSRSMVLNVKKAEATRHAQKLTHPIYQPFIAGREISIDAWLDKHHKLKGHIYRYRLIVRHGESQVTQTVSLPKFDPVVASFLEGLKLSGPVVLQAIIDAHDVLHIIECNARFGGASTLGIKAGVDSFYWSLAESLGHDIQLLPFAPLPTPITQIRHSQDSYL